MRRTVDNEFFFLVSPGSAQARPEGRLLVSWWFTFEGPYRVMLSSPGAPTRVRLGEDVAIMISKVRT